jgi:hypothetical protein
MGRTAYSSANRAYPFLHEEPEPSEEEMHAEPPPSGLVAL